ncbi:hypothetical protein Tco_0664551 [Tanacetum coccineum]
MSVDSAVTYTSVHSEARSWSIPSEDPYEEAARQLLEQAPRSPEYDKAPIEAYITEVASAPPPPPFFLPSLIRPPRTRATMAHMRAAAPSTYHPLLPSGTPALLPIPLPAPSPLAAELDIPEATAARPERATTYCSLNGGCRGWKVRAAASYKTSETARTYYGSRIVAAVRAEIEVLRRERRAYEQESIQTLQDLASSDAYTGALEVRITVLETQARRHSGSVRTVDDPRDEGIIQSVFRLWRLENAMTP